MRTKKQIICVGTMAMVDIWYIRTKLNMPRSSCGRWDGGLVGNDAVIVAHHVKHEGIAVGCILIQPTNTDLELARRMIGREVTGLDICQGTLTRSLCIEGTHGSRNWIMSRRFNPSGNLEACDAAILYLDYYPELRKFLNRSTREIRKGHSSVFVNLSDTSAIADLPRLPFTPTAVQSSIGTSGSKMKAFQLCSQLRERTGAAYVFVTMGHLGAILETSDGRWYSKPPVASEANILGSGAIFSAEAMIGLLRGMKGQELLDHIVKSTAMSLQTDEGHSIRGNKRVG